MNRIDQKFSELRKKKRKAFIAFITAGDPSLKVTEELVVSFAKNGADIVELGVPFSDPLADGPTIQASSQRALNKGVTLNKIFHSVKNIRTKTDIPLALMMYYNQIFHYGEKQFILKAKEVGVDGIIVPDLPPEEAKSLIRLAVSNNISTVFFLSPTTSQKRLTQNIKASSGFIYYVSLTGVTGERRALPSTLVDNVRKAKKLTKKPICVGFGVSTKDQVSQVARVADGVIVGSAIVKEINKYTGKKDLVQKVSRFVKGLSKGTER